MSISWPRAGPARRLLAEQAVRLRGLLAELARRLREGVATATGNAVAALLRGLLGPQEEPYYATRRPGPGWRSSSWQDDPEYDADAWPGTSPYEEGRGWRAEREESADGLPVPGERWRQALAVAAQAALWWLRRPGVHPVLATAGVSLAAGAAAYLAAPLVAGAVALAGSALGLVALADAARAAAEAVLWAVRPVGE